MWSNQAPFGQPSITIHIDRLLIVLEDPRSIDMVLPAIGKVCVLYVDIA